jgi:type IV pilus assembly protein PilB
MSVLSAATQQQVEDDLVTSGALKPEMLESLKQKSESDHAPILSLLVSEGNVSEEQLAKSIAKVTNIPYVNLSNTKVEQSTLKLLPQDVAERYMAVPLGEMQHRLVVAMLDADNVQAVDFLSNKVGRPLKVYAASEQGIRNVLKQYQVTISDSVADEINTLTGEVSVAEAGEEAERQKQANAKQASTDKTFKTLVQDSPISKALSTILEYAAKNRASDIHIEPLQDSLKIRTEVVR